MKAFLSILLGLMFVSSTLVGIAYATPMMQPAQNTGGNAPVNPCVELSPNNPSYFTQGCEVGAHTGGNDHHDGPRTRG